MESLPICGWPGHARDHAGLAEQRGGGVVAMAIGMNVNGPAVGVLLGDAGGGGVY